MIVAGGLVNMLPWMMALQEVHSWGANVGMPCLLMLDILTEMVVR
jgi:hypothetical protein